MRGETHLDGRSMGQELRPLGGFTFLTGVSKFSKVSLFSGLNNLTDIEPEYSTICGYADRELDTVFAPELAGLDRDAIRDWHNSYSWLGAERVYNVGRHFPAGLGGPAPATAQTPRAAAPGRSAPGARRRPRRRRPPRCTAGPRAGR